MLENDATAKRAVELGATPPFAFWLSLACGLKDEKHPFHPYLSSLPPEAPDPCAWPANARALLLGTPLATQVEKQRRVLRAEYDKIAKAAAPPNTSPPTFEEILWARGCHQSRCFPRALVEASSLDAPHEILASDIIDQDERVKDDGASLLRFEHGGELPARVEWSASAAGGGSGAASGSNSVNGASKTAAAAASTAATSSETTGAATVEANGDDEEEAVAGSLGCMLPLLDMLEHRNGHPIGWEAGCGGVRFRCRSDVPINAQLYNNYGPKGNGELLFTYGFAVFGNPLDTVEGIIVGCRHTSNARLAAARLRFLDEQEIPYKLQASGGGALLIGPFDLKVPPKGGGEAAAAAAEQAEAEEEEEEEASVLPPELLFALSIVGMEDADDGPALSLDELDMLKSTLEARLSVLEPTEAVDDAHVPPAETREAFVAAYRCGQRRVLKLALAQIEEMGGEEVEQNHFEV